jgi:DNA-binding response OmpR family regulator
MLTAKDSMEDKVTGLDAGADDYLVKPFGMAELLARSRALQRRSPRFQEKELTVGPLTLDYGTSTVTPRSGGVVRTVPLTAKEFQLLEYFLQYPGQIIGRERLIDRLREVGADPVSNVVAARIRLLRRKLSEYGRDTSIETVYGLGYRLNVRDDGS